LPAAEQRLKLVVLAQVAVNDRMETEVDVLVTVLVP
jgi:hypothetical protein